MTMVLNLCSELFVRVVDMENVMNQQKLEGYTSAVRAVSWDPSGNILVSPTSQKTVSRYTNPHSGHVHARWKDCDMGHDAVTTKQRESP